MASSVITVTPTASWVSGNMYHVLGTIAFSASPATYDAGGNVCSFAQSAIKSQRVPQKVEVKSKTGSGYVYVYVAGTSNADGTLKILTGAAAQSPLTALTTNAAIPAAVSGDTIEFEAIFIWGA